MDNVSTLELSRKSRNIWLFVFIASFVGITYGLGLEVIATYLFSNPETLGVAEGFGTYFGIGTFLAALIVLLGNKIGYKALIIIGVILSAIFPFVAVNFSSNVIFLIVIVIANAAGLNMFTVLVGPVVVTYTTNANRDKIFARVMYMFQGGYIIGTALGGLIIVWRFAARLGTSYSEAKELSSKIAEFVPQELNDYLGAHRDVMIIVAVLGFAQLILALLMRTKKSDYITEKSEKLSVRKMFTKKVVTWLAIISLFFFANGLIIQYASMFMSEMGIARSSISLIQMSDKIISVILLILIPFVVKRMGKVNTLKAALILVIPALILVGISPYLGTMAVSIAAAGIVFRSAVVNATDAINPAIAMEIVPKQFRSGYSSLIFFMNAICMILSGVLNQSLIFGIGGFSLSYLVTAVLYVVLVILLFVLFKNHKGNDYEEESEN